MQSELIAIYTQLRSLRRIRTKLPVPVFSLDTAQATHNPHWLGYIGISPHPRMRTVVSSPSEC